jgi:mRNA interferase HigB
MRIITKARLKRFWELAGHRDSEGPLRSWHAHMSHKSVAWKSFHEVRATISTASLVGNCVVFNIGGNKYRLVTRILYPSQKVFIQKVMTHKEYDEDRWKKECGCFADAPPRTPKGS